MSSLPPLERFPPRPMFQEPGSFGDENVARRNFERFFGAGSYDKMVAAKRQAAPSSPQKGE